MTEEGTMTVLLATEFQDGSEVDVAASVIMKWKGGTIDWKDGWGCAPTMELNSPCTCGCSSGDFCHWIWILAVIEGWRYEDSTMHLWLQSIFFYCCDKISVWRGWLLWWQYWQLKQKSRLQQWLCENDHGGDKL